MSRITFHQKNRERKTWKERERQESMEALGYVEGHGICMRIDR